MHRIETGTADRSNDGDPAATLRVAICMLPAYGHVNPTLRTACELLDRGHEVSYYLPERFTEVVEPTGATFERLDDGYDLMARVRDGPSGMDPAADGAAAEKRREYLVRFVSDSLDRVPALADRVAADGVDRVVTDPMCLWGRAVANELGVPTVAFNTSFAMREGSPLFDELRSAGDDGAGPSPAALTGALDAAGVDDPDLSDFFVADADRALVPLTREFQPDADAFGDDHHFVGPMIRSGDEQRDADLPRDRLADRPSAYVSLGTVVSADEDFFRACFDAFDGGEWEVVLKAKADAERLDEESPGNVHVRSRVPQLDVLDRADAFVTHGGMNSTMESLSAGTPPIVVPQMADQHAVAGRVDALGVGLVLDRKDLTAGAVREAVETVSTETYREAIEEFRAAARAAGGAERAADAIEAAGEVGSTDR